MPADGRLVTAFGFRIQEAALTGESSPVEKDAPAVLPEATSLADRRNSIFMGTVTAAGKARALVAATGMHTELGRIAGLLARQEPEPTPLQKRLAELGRVLVVVCLLLLVAIVFLLELRRGGGLLEVFLVAVSLAVAAVPEGLPAIVTLALALGLQRMAKRNALVRKLPSVETLGSVTVICSDKTGTLTRNEMTVRVIVTGDATYQVSGAGYAPDGAFYVAEPSPSATDRGEITSKAALERPLDDLGLRVLLTAAARCNSTKVLPVKTAEEPGDWAVVREDGCYVAVHRAGLTLGEWLCGELPQPTAERVPERA